MEREIIVRREGAAAAAWIEGSTPASQRQSRPVLIGGRYGLFEQIGSGGMATVYLGRLFGSGGFSRVVAIKRLHEQLSREPEFVTMFRDEVRLSARIIHPNVVQTLDFIEQGDQLFLVMEYVHGESLARLVRTSVDRGERIAPVLASSIVCGVLHGLHAAHDARSESDEPLGIIHRDISPQNILVGADGVSRVLDFGIARAAGRQHLTRAGQIRGKMAYIAPEILRGGNVDRRADVYAVAVVLWEALTGSRLFAAPNDALILANVLSSRVVGPKSIVPDIPDRLDGIVMKGLDRDPENRFSTAREMALAVQQEIGVLAPSEIGDWVAAVAGPTLAERSRQVVGIEKSSGNHFAYIATTDKPYETAKHTAPHSGSVLLGTPDESSREHSQATSDPTTQTPSRAKSGRALRIRIGLMAIILSLGVVFFARPNFRAAIGLGVGRGRVKPNAGAPSAASTDVAPAASIGWIASPAAEPPPEPIVEMRASPEVDPEPPKRAPSRYHRSVAHPRRSQKEVGEDGF